MNTNISENSSEPASPSFKKYFTPAEATKTLPLVKKIVEDILDTSRSMRQLLVSDEQDEQEHHEFSVLRSRLESYMSELEELGCFFKDWNFTIGLVDFPARINDEEVLLCWRSDEPELTHYHSVQAGYMGRKRIPTENNTTI